MFKGERFQVANTIFFLILRDILKRHFFAKIKIDHRKWPFVIKSVSKIAFFFLKIRRNGH